MSIINTKKRSINLTSVIVFVLSLLLVAGNVVFAEPYLQLDASPAIYDPITESIVATDPEFTLYALVNSNKGPYNNTFYLSAAIVPSMPKDPPGSDPTDLGSFDFEGSPINVVEDMYYGSPPLNAILTPDQIAAHGVFDTYYIEFSFVLGPPYENTTLYNSMITPDGPDLGADGPLYYRAFDVDVSELDPAYGVHFDLYTKNPDNSIDQFAPFSHDLATPTPGSLLLGSIGIGMVIARCRKRKTLIES